MDWKLLLCLSLTLLLGQETCIGNPVVVEPDETTLSTDILDADSEGIVVESSEEDLSAESEAEIATESESTAELGDGEAVKSYEGVQVWRVKASESNDQLEVELSELDGPTEVWRVVVDNTTYLDLLVEPDHQDHVNQYLTDNSIEYTTLVNNLQKNIEEEKVSAVPSESQKAEFRTTCTGISGINWYEYHPYNTLTSYMSCLKQQYGHLIDLDTIGRSYEGRDLQVVRVRMGGRIKKKAIWIDGGIHAREWISPATVTYLINEFVEKSEKYRDILERYDIYLTPSINPDGYEYSRNYQRMWRKTRSRNSGSSCVGVDPNRNFGYEWGGKGASSDPCSEIYRGPSPFSESETKAVRDYIMARRQNIAMYLTFHSYGQMVLYPWGFERLDHDDESELHRVGQIANRMFGSGYSVGSAAKVLYPAAGGSDDWAKGGAGIRYSYTIELPDTGRYGFVLPPNQILKVAPKAVEAVKAMINAI